jgi:lysophospholipase L1-like esterase
VLPQVPASSLTAAQAAAVASVVSGAGNALKGIKNFSAKNYPLTRKAMASQAALGQSFPVLCIGDSTTEGYDGTLAGCVSRSWVRRLADALTAKGIKAGWQNFLGDHRSDSQGTTIQAIDTRVTALPAGWSLANGSGIIPGPGGQYWINGSTINPITFTPTVNTDTCDWLYFSVSGYDNLLIKSGAAGATTPSTGGTVTMGALNLIKKATATYTLGANVWTIQKQNVSAATAIIAGCSAYNSTLPEISLWNLGCGGQAASYFNGTTQFWDVLSAVTAAGTGFAAPLAIITLGINDWYAGTTQAAMTTTLTAIVTALQAAGTEVLLVVPAPSVVAIAPLVAQAAIVDAIYAVASAKGCAIVDLAERWVSGAAANTNGYLGDAQLHPSALGYSDIGSAVAEFFLSL